MPMQEGSATEIHYLAPGPNPRRKAWLTATDVHNKGVPILQSTDDPEWIVDNPGDGTEQKAEWIYYLNPAGVYKAKVHAMYNVAPAGPGAGEYIATRFEHEREDGEGNHDDDDMDVQDWDGTLWRVHLRAVPPPFPRQPKFYLSRLQL